MKLIDTHAHIYLDHFKDDLAETVTRAKGNSVEKVYLPNIDSSTIDDLHFLERQYPDFFVAMMGLHPCSVKENYKDELKIVSEWLEKRTYSAVGEIGIDLYWDKSFHKEQIDAFRYQINLSRDYGIPFVIHSRDSLDETIAIVSEMQDGSLNGIFHRFNGTSEQGRKVVDAGFYMGIGGVLTYKNSGVAENIKNLPLENMVLETDAPYLSPVPYRGKRNESSYVLNIANNLSEVKGVDIQEIARITTRNAEKIFEAHTKKEEITIL